VSNEELAHAYFQGYLVLDLIESAYGEAAVRALIEGYGEGRKPAELFAAVLGIDAQGFDRQFDDYVRLRFGRAINALEPAADGAEPPFLASWHAARLALRDGDLDRAWQLAEEARAMFPGFASEGSPYHILAEVHRQRGDVEASAEALDALLRVNADDWAAHIQLAELHRSQNRPEHARRVWESALLIDPFNLALRSDLAASYESEGNWRLAVRERRAVLRLEPDDPVEARFRLALALTEDGKLDEARQEVLDTLENAPLYEAALELLLRIREESSSDS